MKKHNPLYVAIRLLSFVILLGIYFHFATLSTGNNDTFVLASNFAIIFYAWYRIFNNQVGAYSLQQMFYLFALFFYGIAPLIQYKYSVATVRGYFILNDTYLYINFILLLAFLFLDFMYYVSFKKIKSSASLTETNFQLHDNTLLKLLLLFIVVGVVLYQGFINHFDWHSFLLRNGEEVKRVSLDSSVIRKLVSIIIRPLPVFIFIHYYLWGKNVLFKSLLLLCVFLACFPSSMARLSIAAYYIPILIVISPFLRKTYNLVTTYMFSLLVLFPIFGLFRNFNIGIWLHFKERIMNAIINVYTGMTYDSYQSFAFVFQNHFITYGKQLLGVLLLWVPRSFWAAKPIGSGYTMARNYNLGWENIAMNFLGEGYINFGILGVFLFAGTLAILMAAFDKKYWVAYRGNVHTLFAPFFLIMLSNLTFLLRGDLMFGTTVICGTTLSCYIVQRIFIFFKKNK